MLAALVVGLALIPEAISLTGVARRSAGGLFGFTWRHQRARRRSGRADPRVTEIVGLARRVPESLSLPKVRWQRADVTATAMAPLFEGADAVVHLAWAIQPSHDEGRWSGSTCSAASGLRRAPRRRASGRWSTPPRSAPTRRGRRTSRSTSPARRRHPDLRLLAPTRRGSSACSTTSRRAAGCGRAPAPGLIFKAEAASGIRRFFLGPLLPNFLGAAAADPLRRLTSLRLRFQAVHADDVGDAYRLAVLGDAEGAFNDRRRADDRRRPSSPRCSTRASCRSRPRRSAPPPR